MYTSVYIHISKTIDYIRSHFGKFKKSWSFGKRARMLTWVNMKNYQNKSPQLNTLLLCLSLHEKHKQNMHKDEKCEHFIWYALVNLRIAVSEQF